MKIDHILRAGSPWLSVVVETPSEVYDAAWALQREKRNEVASRVLRGTKMRTWAGLFDEIGAALQFPPYFGENGNALDECLNDLEWLEADAYVLTVLDAASVLDREGGEARRAFWEQLKDAANEWGRQAKPFRVVVQCTAEEEAALRARLVSVTTESEA
jgi:Barstar (barnase inhibitor)